MAVQHEGELEWELENEFEYEGGHPEGEGWLGAIAQGIGSLLGEGEFEGSHEYEGAHEYEGSHEFEGSHEYEGSHEWEGAHEFEGTHEFEGSHEFEGAHEYEGSHEFEGAHEYESEEFFRRIGRIARGVGRFVKNNAGAFKSIARIAAPLVGTAIGGPFGAALGKLAATALREGEYEYEAHEFEYEYEGEYEGHHEGHHEIHHEIHHEMHEMPHHEAMAEMMAAMASRAESEAEAEAMAGAATMTVISAADRAALLRVLPHLVRGTAILTRVLRQRRVSRPAVRAVPTIVKRTSRILAQRVRAGQPVTRKTAARVMAGQTARVLGRPSACAAALRHNVIGTGKAVRVTRSRPRTRPRVA